MNKYYVYEWYKIDTDEVIYVGKGFRNRYKVRKHNRLFNKMIQDYKCDSRIIKEFETEQDAFQYEYERINELKSKGECLCNINRGGIGGTTAWWNDELRKKYSQNNVMKLHTQRQRMSLNNPMKKPEIAIKSNAKLKQPVIIGEVEYESVKAVCNAYNVVPSAVRGWCLRGYDNQNVICYYKGNPVESFFKINNGQKRGITYKGKHYESSGALSRALNISQTTASRWCRQGYDSYGNKCRYDDDTRKIFPPIKNKVRPIIVNGIWYPNKQSACRALNISGYTLNTYLDGKAYDTQFICSYDNQQPS